MKNTNEQEDIGKCLFWLFLGLSAFVIAFGVVGFLVGSAKETCEIGFKGSLVNPERFTFNSSNWILEDGNTSFVPAFNVVGSVSIKAPCEYIENGFTNG